LVPEWEQITEILPITQPYAAAGGENGETLAGARVRANVWLKAPVRAVTLDDLETLAKATPGVPVARAHAIEEYHPEEKIQEKNPAHPIPTPNGCRIR